MKLSLRKRRQNVPQHKCEHHEHDTHTETHHHKNSELLQRTAIVEMAAAVIFRSMSLAMMAVHQGVDERVHDERDMSVQSKTPEARRNHGFKAGAWLTIGAIGGYALDRIFHIEGTINPIIIGIAAADTAINAVTAVRSTQHAHADEQSTMSMLHTWSDTGLSAATTVAMIAVQSGHAPFLSDETIGMTHVGLMGTLGGIQAYTAQRHYDRTTYDHLRPTEADIDAEFAEACPTSEQPTIPLHSTAYEDAVALAYYERQLGDMGLTSY